MADTADTSSRVKQLLSSFLSNVGLLKERNDLSRNDMTKVTDVSADTAQTADGCEDVSDSRNKKLFFERVETFSPFTWFAKPVDLSPLVCAMYGWKNVDKDMLQCVHCGVFLCAQLSKPVDAVLYRDSCDRLKKSLIESHNKLCKWRLNPCPESYARIPCHDRQELLKHFMERLKSLQCSRIPKITYKTVEKHGMSEDILCHIVKDIKQLESSFEVSPCKDSPCEEVPCEDSPCEKVPCEDSPCEVSPCKDSPCEEVPCEDVSSVTDICALCGWSTRDSQKDILRCEYCLRKIGVWNFSSAIHSVQDLDKIGRNGQDELSSKTNSVLFNKSETDSTKDVDIKDTEENDRNSAGLVSNTDKDSRMNGRDEGSADDVPHQDEPKRKKQKLEKHDFDPVAEHRFWCPWLQTGLAYSAGSRDNSPTCTPVKTSPDTCTANRSPVKEDIANNGEPAWLLAIKLLGHYISEQDFTEHMKQSPQCEGLRHLRKVLQRCTSPKSPRKQTTT